MRALRTAAVSTLLALAQPDMGLGEERRPLAFHADDRPSRMFWAWERPEDLRFLGELAPDAGIAFHAGTVRLRGEDVVVLPRRQPLRVQEGAYLVAVVRIEADRRDPPSLDAIQRSRLVAGVLDLANVRARAVQIDFDAPRSLRQPYVDLLGALRAALPTRIGLSMTALASWCEGDRWLETDPPPVDEIVPMVFAMGSEGASMRASMSERGELRSSACLDAIGVASDEPWPRVSSARRFYFWSPVAWTRDAAAAALARSSP